MRLFGPLHPLVHFVRAIFQAEWVTTCLIVIDGKAQCLKIVGKVSFYNTASETSFVYFQSNENFTLGVILRESSNETFLLIFKHNVWKKNVPYVYN